MAEVVIALGISVISFAALTAAYLGVQSLNMMSKRHIQAMEVVRGQIEMLKATAYTAIANSTTTVSLDAGPDGTFGTADDIQGTLTVTVRDFLDYDGDGNAAENRISVDSFGGGGSNDDVVLPVRVALSWTQKVFGGTKVMSVSVDTLIAA